MPKSIDHGRTFNYGGASADYAAYRVELPEQLFVWLREVGIGLAGQRLLDLGTGTGLVARRMSRAGAQVSGIDVSEGQIAEARRLAASEGLNIDFRVAPVETPPFADHTFDVATANQAFLYFNAQQAFAALSRVLTHRGLVALSQLRRSPEDDPIAAATDALIKKYNPLWGDNDFGGRDTPFRQWLLDERPAGYQTRNFVRFDLNIPFTRESWRGRIRATRGIGASLPPQQIARFDAEHETLLAGLAPATFAVKHRLEAQVLQRMD
jgi:SAM-dependent methyltransferase